MTTKAERRKQRAAQTPVEVKQPGNMELATCPTCGGTKREEFNNGFLSRKCSHCQGTGKIKVKKTQVQNKEA